MELEPTNPAHGCIPVRVWKVDGLRGPEGNIVAIDSFLLRGGRILRQHISPSPEA